MVVRHMLQPLILYHIVRICLPQFCQFSEPTLVNVEVGDEPGNYGKGNLGLGFLGPVKDPEARKKKLSAELANGRLAMMAIIGMLLS